MARPTLISNKARGFTLIEVISVIVILSLLAVLGGKFVVESTKSYQSTQTRSRLVNTGRQALERMSRQLRLALPNSLRITNSGACVEFMPIVSGGNYTTKVPDSVNGVPPSSTISVSPHTTNYGTPSFVSIGAMQNADIYGASPSSLAALASQTAISLTLGTAKQWARNSIDDRFYLLDKPQAFCVVSGQLRFYDNQSPLTSGVDTSAAYSILADNLTSATPFALSAGTENRNMNVQFNLTFASNGESVAFNQSVMIRNVP